MQFMIFAIRKLIRYIKNKNVIETLSRLKRAKDDDVNRFYRSMIVRNPTIVVSTSTFPR